MRMLYPVWSGFVRGILPNVKIGPTADYGGLGVLKRPLRTNAARLAMANCHNR
jgi:hypothetical protein